MAACLGSDELFAFAIFLSVILTYLSLQPEVVPLHVSLNQIRNWSDDRGEQTDVDSILRDAGHA